MSAPSDDTAPADTPETSGESATTTTAESSAREAAAKPERNSAERLLVWGLIGVLLCVVAVEGAARYGYGSTLSALNEAAEADNEGAELTIQEFRSKVLAGAPTTEDDGNKLVCRWFSLVKTYEIAVTFSDDDPPIVLSHETADAPPEEFIVRNSEPADEDQPIDDGDGDSPADGGSDGDLPRRPGGAGGDAGPGPGGPGGGGGRRGRPRRGLAAVLENEEVVAALELDDATKTALEEAVSAGGQGGGPGGERPSPEERAEREREQEAKVAEVLGPEKFEIVRRRLIRDLGVRALSREDVATELGLDEEQQTKLADLAEAAGEKRRELFASAQEIGRDEVMAKMRELGEESLTESLAVLSDEQRERWDALVAEE